MRAAGAVNVPPGPFRIAHTFADPLRRALMALAQPALERVLAFPTLNSLYAGLSGSPDTPFSQRALDVLSVRLGVSDADLAHVPARGPLLVVANHPFGALDGLALHSLLSRVRPDVKLLGNYLLHLVPDLRETVLAVDPFGGPTAPGRSLAGLKAALRWLRDGGCLGIFPAGEVSHLDVSRTRVTDPPWSPMIARLARQPGVHVLPVYFSGANSAVFQMAGLLHPRLRTVLLPRELLRRRSSTVSVRIGRAVPPGRVGEFAQDEALTAYLRARTYLLDGGRARALIQPRPVPVLRRRGLAPVAAAVPPGALAAEVDRLPAAQTLLAHGRYSVFWAGAATIPAVLHEIGRLREQTFRGAGEGTGRPRDLDPFDRAYLHLCVWDRDARAVVGAYRLGLTDEILRTQGIAGLYTHTLFQYDQRLLDRLSPAIELGRSFVRPEYQREYAPLMLLWKGIGQFVATRPHYQRLFGPVSISNDYSSFSRLLLMAFLQANRALPDLARLVSPRNPPRLSRLRDSEPVLAGRLVADLDEVDGLVADIEADGRGLPVLLRQYLKLNARLLAFNVDARFGNALDGLMLVDLRDVPRAILVRYMGREGADAFLESASGVEERKTTPGSSRLRA